MVIYETKKWQRINRILNAAAQFGFTGGSQQILGGRLKTVT